MAHPAFLHSLLDEYAALTALHAERGDPASRRRLDDVSYTLCVITGTRDIDTALVAARFRLPGARPQDDSVLAPRADTRKQA
jgi:hypothetical protein